MILTALVAASAMASSAADYYPLIPGTKWTYENEGGLQMEEEIGQPLDIGNDLKAYPKVRRVMGKTNGGAELYRTEGDALYLFGTVDDKIKPPANPISLMKEPQPILRVSDGKLKWKYVSELPTGNGPTLVTTTAESTKGPKRTVLGRDVETVLVHVVSQIGNDKSRFEVRSDAVYGKGIGLVEVNEATKVGGDTVKRMLKLVKFEPPQG